MEVLINRRNTGVTFDSVRKVAQVRVWAPGKSDVKIEIPYKELIIPLKPREKGYWTLQSDKIAPGDQYRFILNGEDGLPDPASVSQPDGVHGLSEAVDLTGYRWQDSSWKNPSLSDYIIYELHSGTFTKEGTLTAIIDKLPYFKLLGITAIEIMPVAQFPGSRNWGYDGVFPFAVQNSYGGYKALQQLTDACHQNGIAVILDVVYNHFGPEGNVLGMYGPYFTDKYKTPWGQAINFDDAGCDGVRDFYIENALMWLRDFHVDALRLDAVHAIKDLGANHFLSELSGRVSELERITKRNYYLIAECDLNDPKYICNRNDCGYGLHAQWVDEFHHALRMTAGEKPTGYYSDFKGIKHLAKAYRDVYVYDGVFSEHRNRTFGASASRLPADKFVVFSQNHDQIGNRMLGERTSKLLSFEMQKLLAGAVLVSPYIPMLFMGEEWSASSPFLYFVSHTNKELIEAVRKGRKEEFKEFHAQGEAPDPQSEETFIKSKIPWQETKNEPHSTMLVYYKALIDFRKKYRDFLTREPGRFEVSCHDSEGVIGLSYRKNKTQLLCVLNFSSSKQQFPDFKGEERLQVLFNSAAPKWKGKHPLPDEVNKSMTIQLPPESITIYSNKHV
ncbi:MAG: malto-oligosyltrehalose trehalohydrolase [Prolixibacteraceae bacterium]|nr:malto-oligosyltrehalose trehalohydrolase [Prolixibacteraceae bacterium]